MSLLDLPNELLHDIATHLDLDRDLNSLTQTNRLFYSLLNDHLYRRNTERGSGPRLTALLWATRHGQQATAQKCLGSGANPSYRILHDALLAAVWHGGETGSEGITQLLLEALEVKSEGEGGELALRLLVNERKRNLVVHTQPVMGWIGDAVGVPLAIVRRLRNISSSNSDGGGSSSSPQVMVLTHSRFHGLCFPERFKSSLRGTNGIPANDIDTLSVESVLSNRHHTLQNGREHIRGQIHDGGVVVGTPGHLRDEILRKKLDPEGIKLLVIYRVDEFPHFQMDRLCHALRRLLPEDIQIIIFPEVFPEEVREFSREIAPDAITALLVQPGWYHNINYQNTNPVSQKVKE